MLELGGRPPRNDLIKDVSEADFMAEVVEASQDGAGDRGFLGAVVWPVQNAGPGTGSGGDRSQGCRAHGQGQCR